MARQVGEVCFETKVARDINKMYEIRAELHSKVYQHRVANVVEAMVTDVFLEAEDAYRFRGEDGSPPVSLSHAARVPEHFVMLTDSILGDILRCPQPGLERARELLLRLMNRNHYEWLGNQPLQVPTQPTCNNCHAETNVEDRFCYKCGRSLKDRPSSSELGSRGGCATPRRCHRPPPMKSTPPRARISGKCRIDLTNSRRRRSTRG